MKHELSQATAHTITTPKELLEDLKASRERGYTMTRGENVADVLAVATPLTCGGISLGVTVAGPFHRMEQHLDRITQELLACVQGIQL